MEPTTTTATSQRRQRQQPAIKRSSSTTTEQQQRQEQQQVGHRTTRVDHPNESTSRPPQRSPASANPQTSRVQGSHQHKKPGPKIPAAPPRVLLGIVNQAERVSAITTNGYNKSHRSNDKRNENGQNENANASSIFVRVDTAQKIEGTAESTKPHQRGCRRVTSTKSQGQK